MNARIDWDDLRVVFELRAAGSANALATKTGTSHTTVLRRISNLESNLGIKLMIRDAAGARLTPEGEILAETAEQMQQNFLRGIKTLGDLKGLVGEVRINVTQGLGALWLAPHLLPWQDKHPGMKITYQTMTPRYLKVGAETDICIRWGRPSDPDVIAKKLGEVGYSLYMGDDYASQRGLPSAEEDLNGLELLHFEAHDVNPAFQSWIKLISGRVKHISFENHVIADAFIRSGKYSALLPDYSPNSYTRIRKSPINTGVRLELWLAYHSELRDSKRLRAVVGEILRLAEEAKKGGPGRQVWFE